MTLKWNAIADDSVTGYGVQLYDNTTGLTVGPVCGRPPTAASPSRS